MPIFNHTLVRRALPAVLVFALVGCDRKEARTYIAPKDKPFVPPPATAAPPTHPDQREVWRPALKYTVPAGWKELGPDEANVARFSAGEAMVTATALASMAGGEAALVNMWRQIRGQAPLSDEEAMKTLSDVPIAGSTGKMFEVADQEAGKTRRFIIAFVHRPEGSLFFKIQGDDSAVSAQKPAFFEFLKTVQFAEGTTPAPAPASVQPAPSARAEPTAAIGPEKIPDGWTSVPPGPMQVAKYRVPEKDGGKAEVAVSVFPSDTGGTVANVKRWRSQLGLPDVDDAAAQTAATPFDGAPAGSVLVNLENAGRTMLGAIVPRDGQWWFYKLTGDSAAVTAARESFVSFAKGQP